MVLKAENQTETRMDWLKWLTVTVLLLAGFIANYYYTQTSTLIRVTVGILIIAAAGLLGSRTQKGRWLISFIRESRNELRKVIWPTADETMKTTLVVAAMVTILALFLWGVDGLLVWLIGWLTGQRG